MSAVDSDDVDQTQVYEYTLRAADRQMHPSFSALSAAVYRGKSAFVRGLPAALDTAATAAATCRGENLHTAHVQMVCQAAQFVLFRLRLERALQQDSFRKAGQDAAHRILSEL